MNKKQTAQTKFPIHKSASLTHFVAWVVAVLCFFLALTPAFSAVSPATGPIYGGTPVTITGTGFDPSVMVYIGGTQASDVVYVSSTTLTAVTPESFTEGPVDVDIQTATDYITQTSAFTYVSPTITSVSPVEGTIAGGYGDYSPWFAIRDGSQPVFRWKRRDQHSCCGR
jgi:hypothetical protein